MQQPIGFFFVKVHNIYQPAIKLTEKWIHVTRAYFLKGYRALCVSIMSIIELHINYKISLEEVV